MRLSPIFSLAALLVLAAPLAAQGVSGSQASVSLIEGWRQDDGTHLAAVEIRLAPGWHTYWRAPGDSGIPPQFDWSGSSNLSAVAYEWPRPEVFRGDGLTSFGFMDELVLPVRLVPEDPSAPIEAHLDLFFGVCDEICVPAQALVTSRLVPGVPPEGQERINASLAERPSSARDAGVQSVTCGFSRQDNGKWALTTEVTFKKAAVPEQVAVLESGTPGVWIGMPETVTRGNTVTARARFAGAENETAMIDRQSLRITLVGRDRAIDIHGCQAPG